MNSKVFLVFAIQIFNSAHNHRCQFLFHFVEDVLAIVDNIVESSLDVITVRALLLDGEHQSTLNEPALLRWGHFPRQYS